MSLVLNTLTPREHEIVRMRFGLDGRREHNQREVAEYFKVRGMGALLREKSTKETPPSFTDKIVRKVA
jgi:hypothetical protein